MAEIKDSGKVWIRGEASPQFALRVDEKFIVPGNGEDQKFEFWVEGDSLCIDFHDPAGEMRMARRFRLDLPSATPASLFSGFRNTQHADVRVLTHRDEGVTEFCVRGEDYRAAGVERLDPGSFWKLSGL